ncbi:MAG TPA: hypothetical protein VGR28_00070 [Candidatus Thermoplasmatota archaeon]|jgi:hypothetical protein|nr:hypothetical protein [Candidatus Thermoplasmatota archaeon]
MADPLYVIIRVLHVGSAIALIGGATLWGTRIMPTLAQLGPTLPKGAIPTLGNRVVNFLPAAGLATFLTGLLLFWQLGGFSTPANPWSMLLGTALLLTLVMLILSFGVMKPSWKKLSQAMGAAAGPPGPEMMALSKRMKSVSMANLAIGWTIVLLMVVATATR